MADNLGEREPSDPLTASNVGVKPCTRAKSLPTNSLISSHALMPFGGSPGSGSLSRRLRKGSSASCIHAGSAGLQGTPVFLAEHLSLPAYSSSWSLPCHISMH